VTCDEAFEPLVPPAVALVLWVGHRRSKCQLRIVLARVLEIKKGRASAVLWATRSRGSLLL